ncbi:TIGR03088 family PEP-CTERM/XrtA system glycosyltransferase [Magnetococcales bacterium HHB-1]
MPDDRPLIVHVAYRLATGGMETVLVNLINQIDHFRHAVVCLTDYSDFKARIFDPEIEIFALHKKPGKDPAYAWRFWKLMRKLKPDIVHTCNLAALECTLLAWLAGVPVSVHAEHGRDIYDLEGKNRKYQILRKFFSHWTHRMIAVSGDLERWLIDDVKIPAKKVIRIINGVPVEKINRPPEKKIDRFPKEAFILGTVGRLSPVKNQSFLLEVFAELRNESTAFQKQAFLVLVGDGSLHKELKARVSQLGIEENVWLAGEQKDVIPFYHLFSLFLLPSLAEGTPLTVLEAMAARLPVIASNVGGLPELITPNRDGLLLPVSDKLAWKEAILKFFNHPKRVEKEGLSAERKALKQFSLEKMTRNYLSLFQHLTNR